MAHAAVLQFSSRLARHQHVIWLPETAAVTGIEIPRREAGLVHAFRHNVWALTTRPRIGRFYPSHFLPGKPPMPMFRVTAVDAATFTADMNVPLSGFDARLGQLEDPALPDGMGSEDWLLRWAGMEIPLPEADTDFSEAAAFDREDEAPDPEFYQQPRKLLHVDSLCSQRIEACYRNLVPDTGQVLDLMGSWHSHLPGGCDVTALGLNAEEMTDNPLVQEMVVQDLNRETALPFPDHHFDTVVNTVSWEYLTRPAAVLDEVRRILKPGGRCAISFSNRFFPTKAIALWSSLHPMEKVGWVLQLLQQAGFAELVSHVERGLPRPADDRYIGQYPESDPVFVVWGKKPG